MLDEVCQKPRTPRCRWMMSMCAVAVKMNALPVRCRKPSRRNPVKMPSKPERVYAVSVFNRIHVLPNQELKLKPKSRARRFKTPKQKKKKSPNRKQQLASIDRKAEKTPSQCCLSQYSIRLALARKQTLHTC